MSEQRRNFFTDQGGPDDEVFMRRCLQLAISASGYTAPNPMVGAVLVYKEKIIGEGFHRFYGGPHAEVNCINSVGPENREFIALSTLYVSLEPCCHYGKTPPCTDLIIREKIPKVVIGCRDPFPEVDGKGIEKLKAHGVDGKCCVLEKLSKQVNRRFFTFHQQQRPFIVLKWAQSADRKIAATGNQRTMISNGFSNRLVHKWRSEEQGILIGTETALLDNPALTTRFWPGKNPVRIVVDRDLRLPQTLKIFDGQSPLLVLNTKKDKAESAVTYIQIDAAFELSSILSALYSAGIISILVEGGGSLLQSFIDIGIWDEMRVITNQELEINNGHVSPQISGATLIRTENYGSDQIDYYTRNLSLTVFAATPDR